LGEVVISAHNLLSFISSKIDFLQEETMKIRTASLICTAAIIGLTGSAMAANVSVDVQTPNARIQVGTPQPKKEVVVVEKERIIVKEEKKGKKKHHDNGKHKGEEKRKHKDKD
jgi:hypothetical protein